MHMAVPNASQLENVQARRTCRGRGAGGTIGQETGEHRLVLPEGVTTAEGERCGIQQGYRMKHRTVILRGTYLH